MLTIGKLAALSEVSADTLRFYERQGLIVPASKSAAGYRLYGEDAVVRLRFIKQARECGFTLAEIEQLLVLRSQDVACCGDVRQRWLPVPCRWLSSALHPRRPSRRSRHRGVGHTGVSSGSAINRCSD